MSDRHLFLFVSLAPPAWQAVRSCQFWGLGGLPPLFCVPLFVRLLGELRSSAPRSPGGLGLEVLLCEANENLPRAEWSPPEVQFLRSPLEAYFS